MNLKKNARQILGHRLGFAVKAMGAEIPSHDTRKHQNSPHLRISLEYFDRMLDYLAAKRIGLYRLSSEFAPFSSPRTELRTVERKVKGKKVSSLQPPLTTQHADFINPFEFAYFLRETDGLAFDVMLEAKAKDLAVLRLCDEFVKRPWLLTADNRGGARTATG